MRKLCIATCFMLSLSGQFGTLHANDNESFFKSLVPDNASISAVKESGGKTLKAGEDVLENVVEDSKGFGSFLFKKAGELVEGTKNTFKSLTE